MAKFTESLATVTYETTSCVSCGARFAMDAEVLAEKRAIGGPFYCPNGHSLTFGKTEVQRLRDEKAALTAALDQTRAAKETAARKVARIKQGVCPECGRTFKALARHMQTRHSKK